MGNTGNKLKKKQFLFLDRDGVINVHRPNDYVKTIDEFEFLPGAPEALAILSKLFNRIIIVTNQRGVSKGKLNEQTLHAIHEFMLSEIKAKGGRIDAIYYCTALHEDHPCRKPNGGMALQAKQDFPEIDFSQSIMVGDSKSDIEFGNRLGMTTVLIKKETSAYASLADFEYPSLIDFALSVGNE